MRKGFDGERADGDQEKRQPLILIFKDHKSHKRKKGKGFAALPRRKAQRTADTKAAFIQKKSAVCWGKQRASGYLSRNCRFVQAGLLSAGCSTHDKRMPLLKPYQSSYKNLARFGRDHVTQGSAASSPPTPSLLMFVLRTSPGRSGSCCSGERFSHKNED